jgi:hypothetical protein
LIQLEGQPPVSATQYEQQVLRCSACQTRYTASPPEGVPPVKYLPSCDVAIAMWKYSAGVPFTRFEKVQSSFGVPLSESVMYERCENVASAVLPIYLHLRAIAAQGKVFYSDDTKVKILSLIKENKSRGPDERRGMQTSAIVSEVDDKKIALYASGRRHCGENIFDLMKERKSGLSPPIQMADPLSANWSVKFEREEAKCLVHARRQFIDIESSFPQECARVLNAIKEVYEVEAQTKGMSDSQRLIHHQEKSSPVMSELKEWIEKEINEKRAEPNSSLGKAYAYTLRHWKELTQFLVLPGCPIDNNEAERALKLVVLNRKSSLFYKTENGAFVGDLLMSLIRTCELNGVRAWDYLLELVRNRDKLRREPADWLPWSYQKKPDQMNVDLQVAA